MQIFVTFCSLILATYLRSSIVRCQRDDVTQIDSTCPAELQVKKLCRCHYGNLVPLMGADKGFMLHCTVAREIDLKTELAYFSKIATTPVDMILSSSYLPNFGKDLSGWAGLNLVGLRLFHNNLTHFSPLLFKGLERRLIHLSYMEEAGMSGSKIDLEELLVSKVLKKLKDLFVSVYHLERLNLASLVDLKTLESISITANSLKWVRAPPVSPGKKLDSLKRFTIQSNLSAIPASAILSLAPNLRHLSFTSQALLNLTSSDLSPFNDIISLAIPSSHLRFLESKVFAPLINLKNLGLHGNLLSHLASDVFYNLTQLVQLDLSFNRLTSLSTDLLSPLTSLEVLNLRGNLLTLLDLSPFKAYANAIFTRFQRGASTSDDPEVDLLHFLISQNFTDYQTRLRTLKLSLNALTQVSPTVLLLFKNSLSVLDVSHNRLDDSFPFLAFKGYQNLTWLDVGSNAIRNMSSLSRMLQDETDIVYLGLSGNPWDCDCHSLAQLALLYQKWTSHLTRMQVAIQKHEWSQITCNLKLSSKGNKMAWASLGAQKASLGLDGTIAHSWSSLCPNTGIIIEKRKFASV